MPTWNKRTKHDRLSKSMVFNTTNSQERDLFLELAMPVISKTDTRIDSRLRRIEFEISGSYGQVDNIQKKLRNLASYAYEATNPDKHQMYYYHNTVITKLFSPPINTQLFAACIEEFDFAVKIVHDGLATTADMDELQAIYNQVVELKQQLPSNINRDIERFILPLSLAIAMSDPNQVLAKLLEYEYIQESTTGLQFTAAPEVIRTSMLKRMTQVGSPKDYLSIHNIFESKGEVEEFIDAESDALDQMTNSDEDISLFSDSLLGGGKVVFFKNGQEISDIDEALESRDTEKLDFDEKE